MEVRANVPLVSRPGSSQRTVCTAGKASSGIYFQAGGTPMCLMSGKKKTAKRMKRLSMTRWVALFKDILEN